MKQTEFKCVETNDQLVVKVIGDISAGTEFPAVALKAHQKMTFQMEDSGYINSSGIQSWIKWFKILQEKNATTTFTFQMLPSNYSHSAYQLRGFLPQRSKVESFLAPYFCESCEKAFNFTFVKGANWKSNWTRDDLIENIKTAPCPKCKKGSKIDAIPEVFAKVCIP